MQFNVSNFLSTQAKKNPEANAVIYSYKSNFWTPKSYSNLSFRELDAMVDALVHQFLFMGVERGLVFC